LARLRSARAAQEEGGPCVLAGVSLFAGLTKGAYVEGVSRMPPEPARPRAARSGLGILPQVAF
jgi:hypothetical protein